MLEAYAIVAGDAAVELPTGTGKTLVGLLDMRARRATIHVRAIEPSAREYMMLEVLMRHAGQVLSGEQAALPRVGATTTIPAPTSSTSTSATSAGISART